MAHSISTAKSRKPVKKPEKPHKDFPLFPHATKRWAKKVRGKLHYFGPWDDPDGALNLWLEQRDEILAGRKPRQKANSQSVSVQDATDFYLDHIEEQVSKGKKSHHWYQDNRRTCEIMCEVVGRNWAIDSLTDEDFKQLAERFEQKEVRDKKGKKHLIPASPVTTQGHIHRTRGLFNWLIRAEKIKTVPQYGIGFDPPELEQINRYRDDQPTKCFSRSQVRALLKASKGDTPKATRMHAAIMLAINTGCQNIDIATLKFKHIDWRGGWYLQPRKKKSKKRRAKLWKRTVRALSRMVGDRDREPESLVFVSDRGGAWDGRNCLAKEFPAYRDAAKITTPRAGFQWLRHSFITEASQLGDRESVKIACGHASRDITDRYIHKIHDPRLIALADHVEQWLIGGAK